MTRPGTTKPLHALVRDTRGASLAEYIILVGVIAILALVAFRQFGYRIRFKVDQQSTTVSTVDETTE